MERIFINSNNIEKLFLTKTRAEADVVVQRLQTPGFPNVISVDKFRVSRTKWVRRRYFGLSHLTLTFEAVNRAQRPRSSSAMGPTETV